jgi:hypothetical protein
LGNAVIGVERSHLRLLAFQQYDQPLCAGGVDGRDKRGHDVGAELSFADQRPAL